MTAAAEQLRRRLSRGDVIVLDGGMGSELQARGVAQPELAWTGAHALTAFDTVREIHEEFIRAGAELVIADTFFATRPRLEHAGLHGRVAEVNRRAVQAAIEARTRAEQREVVIAGAISYSAVLDPQGRHETLAPRTQVSRRQALADYREQAFALVEAGVDVIALEMMVALDHAQPALDAALETGAPVMIGVSAGRRTADGRVPLWRDGQVQETGELADLLAALVDARPLAISVMHTELPDVDAALEIVRSLWRGPVGCYPHVGTGGPGRWIHDDLEPDAFADAARAWLGRDVQLIGGCCGVAPRHIAALAALCRSIDGGSQPDPRAAGDR
jgi:homocysteine S-methyltransferase